MALLGFVLLAEICYWPESINIELLSPCTFVFSGDLGIID